MANHYIRQDIEREMIILGLSPGGITDFINNTLREELDVRKRIESGDKR